jgi:hypothetical protein
LEIFFFLTSKFHADTFNAAQRLFIFKGDAQQSTSINHEDKRAAEPVSATSSDDDMGPASLPIRRKYFGVHSTLYIESSHENENSKLF